MEQNFWHSADGVAIYGVNPLTEYCQNHTLSEFIESICIDRTIVDQHVYPQYTYVDGIPKYIIRFETLSKDLQNLEELGILRRSNNYNVKRAVNKSIRDTTEISNDDSFMLESFYRKDFTYYNYPIKSVGDNHYIDISKLANKLEKLIVSQKPGLSTFKQIMEVLDSIKLEISNGNSSELVARMLKRSAIEAVKFNDLATLKILIKQYNVDIDTINIKDKSTLLHSAKYKKYNILAKWLISNGADISLKNVYED
jgi:hypothetical protein